MGNALDELGAIRSDDAAAAEVMRSIRHACRTLGDTHLTRLHDVLASAAMTTYRRAEIGGIDLRQASTGAIARDRSWEVTTDPFSRPHPTVPGVRTFDEVLAAVRSGDLVPMTAPIDAHGRAGAHYTSIAFAPQAKRRIGELDMTSDLLKVIDFFSDGLPVGWREHHTMRIYYLPNARVTTSVHTLTAYDRDEGPETMLDRTTEAIVSGYMIVEEESSTAEVNVGIGPGTQDDTQAFSIATQSIKTYSGMFYPDYPPDFQPAAHEPRFEHPDEWTFTTSSAPMVDGWGTWKL
jgi:hypothetical protein